MSYTFRVSPSGFLNRTGERRDETAFHIVKILTKCYFASHSDRSTLVLFVVLLPHNYHRFVFTRRLFLQNVGDLAQVIIAG